MPLYLCPRKVQRVSCPSDLTGEKPLYRNFVRRGQILAENVTGIAGHRRFKHENLSLRHGAMLDAARHDAELARLQNHLPILELDDHFATPNEEQLILMFVMMPWKESFRVISSANRDIPPHL